MTIQFLSESERIRHPQAGLIPKFLWSDHFREKLNAQDEALMKLPFAKLRDEEINDDNWYCIMLSQNDTDDSSILELAKLFYISTDIFVIGAVAAGRIGLVIFILTSPSYKPDPAFKNKEEWLLLFAAILNQPKIIELIYERNPTEVIKEISEDYSLLNASTENNAFESCGKLLELLGDNAKEVVKSRYYEKILKRSISFGKITLTKNLLTLSGNKPFQEIRSSVENLLSFACDNNQPELIDFLIEFNSDFLSRKIDQYYLKKIIEKGNLSILNKLINHAHDKVCGFITENGYQLVKLSAEKGHFDITERCFELLNNHNITTIISSKDYDLFASSIINGQVEFAQKLYHLMSNAAEEMMIARDYLSLAGKTGNLKLIEWLLTTDPICSPEIDWFGKGKKWLWTEVRANPSSVEFSHLIKWLETPRHKKALQITLEGFKIAFLLASETNNLGLLNKLMIYSQVAISHNFSTFDSYKIELLSSAFALAAKMGHIDLMDIFIELDLAKAPDMIKHQKYEAFHLAIEANQHEAVDRIIELLSENDVYDMLESHYHKAFVCNEKTNLSLISKLLEWFVNYKLKKLTNPFIDLSIFSNIFNKASYSALKYKRLDIFKKIFEIFPAEFVRREVIDDRELFQLAVETGIIEFVDMVLGAAGDEAKTIIAENGPEAFRNASCYGYSDICNSLFNAANYSTALVAEQDYASFFNSINSQQYELTETLIKVIGEDIRKVIAMNDASAVGKALEFRNIPLCYKLLELAIDVIQKSIDQHPNIWLRLAGGYQPGVEFLLQFPSVFSRIASYVKGKHRISFPSLRLPRLRYADFLNTHIDKTLQLLKKKELAQDQLSLNNSLDNNSKICCYYIMRHLIKRNTTDSLSDLHFLLTIPSLYHLIFTLESPVKANKLLDLCISKNNIQALVLLMCIPTIFDIVMQTKNYRQEAQSALEDLDQVLPPEKLTSLPSLFNAHSTINPSSFFKYKSPSNRNGNSPDSFHYDNAQLGRS